MSKRVLRDRSTLRPPSDEPPIKKVPPKPKTIRGPFPFEDLPQEFYNRVLEKMPTEDFKTFNCSSKLSARICEEFEMKDGPFPLGELPQDIYSAVVEKMSFKDLTMFCLGSKLTVKMVEQLKVIKAPVKKVYIVKRAESFKTPRKKRRLNIVPKSFRLHAEELEIDQKDLTAIEKYKMSADKVSFYGETGVDAEFVRKILNLTHPKELYFDSTSLAVLKLEELKQMDGVTFLPWNNFDDSDLLSINLESFTIGLRPWHKPENVTSQGILQLLQEWKAGVRQIKKIMIWFERLDKELILADFPGHPQHFTSERLVLCKEDGESDCLLDTAGPWAKIVEQECEGEGKRYSRGCRIQCRCYRWTQIRRSPPL